MDQATSALQGIPFEQLIGGPLTAAVKAQTLAAKTSVEFIRSVGFNDKGEVVNVTFIYQRDGRTVSLNVPLLTIVPIPYLRIDDMTINFKAQMSASGDTNSNTTDSFEAKASLNASGGFWGQKYGFNASVSSKKDSSSSANSKYSIEYTMDINVRAVQDDMPKGLSTVLGLLNEQMKPVPQAVSQKSISDAWDAISKLSPNADGTAFDITATSVNLKDTSTPQKAVPGVPVTIDLLADGKLLSTVQGKTNASGTLESDLRLTIPGLTSDVQAMLRMTIEGSSQEVGKTLKAQAARGGGTP